MAAVGALVGMLETLPQDLRRSKAMPRLRQLCTENAGEADLAKCLARLTPTIFAKVRACLLGILKRDMQQHVII